MPQSDRPLSPDPIPPPVSNDVPGARPVRRNVTPQQFDDHLIAELLANEAAVMASIGILPESAPAPSPGLSGDITEVWAAAEARLQANGQAGVLSKQAAGNTRDLMFYPEAPTPGRRGLWLAEGCAYAHHYSQVATDVLVENARALQALESLLGVVDVRTQLLLAGQEHLLRQHGVL